MISNQILQATLDGLKAIARVDLAITDPEGRTVVSTGDIPGISACGESTGRSWKNQARPEKTKYI